MVIEVLINGHKSCALLDSGSLGDFISTTLADQLKLKQTELAKPIELHLAVQGSRSKVNYGTQSDFKYQNIKERRYFDIVNLSNYDVILGTPFLFQHKVSFGLNEEHIIIGSDKSVPIRGENVARIDARAVEIAEEQMGRVREHLFEYASLLFVDAAKTPLPLFRAINHEIPIIDEQ